MSIARIASVPAFALRVSSTSTRTSPHPARARVPIRTAHVASDSSSTATMPADAPSLRLCYFDVMAKGLQVTMVAHHSGLEWQGKPEGFSWRDGPNAMKPSAPFGQLPLLFVGGDDKPPVAQATAIASVIGKLANTDGGSDMNDFAMSNMLLAQGEDMYNALQKGQPTLYAKIGSRHQNRRDARGAMGSYPAAPPRLPRKALRRRRRQLHVHWQHDRGDVPLGGDPPGGSPRRSVYV